MTVINKTSRYKSKQIDYSKVNHINGLILFRCLPQVSNIYKRQHFEKKQESTMKKKKKKHHHTNKKKTQLDNFKLFSIMSSLQIITMIALLVLLATTQEIDSEYRRNETKNVSGKCNCYFFYY